jgi:cupin fold WbuC family metalloprotein
MNLHKLNDEVFIARDPIVHFGDEEVAFVKRQAHASPRRRARICAHRTNDDALHEMLIAISSASYIRPHRHVEKSESFHVVDGIADVAILDDNGNVTDVIALGPPASGRAFFYRLSESAFHTLLIRSDVLVIHEVTNGPFAPERTIVAPFAPSEERTEDVRRYMQQLSEQVASHLSRAPA